MTKTAFGLSLSVDRDWSWCPDASREARPQLRAFLGSLGPVDGPSKANAGGGYYRSPSRADDGRPAVLVDRMAGGRFHVRYADETEFVLDGEGTEVRARWPSSSTLEDTLVYLQGPILGFALRLRGVTCLHASAAVVDERAVAVLGSAATGKSTTAASFAKRGLAILTDDLLALADRGQSFLVQPGLPRVLLWPESAEALFGDPEALPRVVSTWRKRYLDLTQPGYRFCAEPRRLGAIYVLGERGATGSSPSIESLAGARALIHLVANTYANYLLEPRMRAQELEVLGRLATHVPLRLVHAPDDLQSIAAVCDAILDDFRALRVD